MDKAKEYINSKTNSILKTNILRNNRDVVATIVYNELTDLLEFSNASSVTTPIDSEILKDIYIRLNRSYIVVYL